jgi:hypothetical protein
MLSKFEENQNFQNDDQPEIKVDGNHIYIPHRDGLEIINIGTTGETCGQDSFTILDNNNQLVQKIPNIKYGQYESATQPGVPISHATLEQIKNGDIRFVFYRRSDAQLAEGKQDSLAESCQFFIDCFNQSIRLPIDFALKFIDFITEPLINYSANLVKECPSYTPSGNWNRIQGGNNRNQFFAGSTNASLCQQIASSSLPQIGQ